MSGPDASSECRDPALFLLGPGALCVGARRSLRRGPALWGVGVAARQSTPKTLFSRYRRSVLGLALTVCLSMPALFVSGPGALSIGLRRSLSGRIVSISELGALRRSLCRGPAVSLSGPGALCRGPARRSLCRGCVGARHSLRQGPARLLSVGARRSVSPGGPPAPISVPPSRTHPQHGPRAPIRVPPLRHRRPQIRSACHLSGTSMWHSSGTAGPQL